MYYEKVNRTELKILELILQSKTSEKDLAKELNMSLSWISECTHHLVDIGFVIVEKKGISNFPQIINNALGESLKRLMIENRMLDLDAVLPDSGSVILPLLLFPGSNFNDISKRTHLSKRMIHNKLREWKSMGLIDLKKYPDVLILNERDTYLTQYLIEFCKTRNRLYLSKMYPSGIIVWEWRDEFIFTIGEKIEDSEFLKAGVTGLEDYSNELYHSSEYYYYCIGKDSLSLEEILVQTVRIDPLNPRLIRIIKQQISDGNIDKKILFTYGKKYEIYQSLKERL